LVEVYQFPGLHTYLISVHWISTCGAI
jgi:hypothetical protein